jgi:hypothetical protein
MVNLKESIIEKIVEVVEFICKNPLIYVSETDIHALMISELFKIDQLNPFDNKDAGLYKTGMTIGCNKRTRQPSSARYKTMLVHKEYGHNQFRFSRSDIVIFDPAQLEDIDSMKLVSNKNKGKFLECNLRSRGYLTPRFIFEFGTETVASNFREHFEDDLKKVGESGETGFLIHIQRFFAKNKISEKTLKPYKNMTKEIWWHTDTKRDKIKPLVFLIKIGNERQSIGSKIDMFDPYNTNKSKSSWRNIPIHEVADKTKKLLVSQERIGVA